MKRFLKNSIVLCLSFFMSLSLVNGNVFAKENEDINDKKAIIQDNYLEYKDSNWDNLLWIDDNYGYTSFLHDFESNGWSQYFFHMTDFLIQTGTKPSKEKYKEVLINIVATYDFDNAHKVAEQQKLDHLKSIDDYGKDIGDIAKGFISFKKKYHPVEKYDKLLDRVTKTIDWSDHAKAVVDYANIEAVIIDYVRYIEFFELIADHSSGDLKAAAKECIEPMNKLMELRLKFFEDLYSGKYADDVRDELFFKGGFLKLCKQFPEYEEDETFKFFIDGTLSLLDIVSNLKGSFDLGLLIGKTIGNVVVNSEDQINRILEMMAVAEIGQILKDEIYKLDDQLIEKFNVEDCKRMISLSQYLIGCRIRGEYCVYSIVAKNSGLLSWMDKKSAEDAKKWYEKKVSYLKDIQNSVEKIVTKDVSNIYKFDQTPVKYNNKGYLVKVDGKYGFINTDGEYIYEPKYPEIYIWQFNSNKENLLALMSDSSQGVNVADGSRFFPGVGSGAWDNYTIVFNASKKDIYRKSFIEEESDWIMSSKSGINDNSFVIYDDKDIKESNLDFYNTIPYYVYIPQSERLYGKYSPNEFAYYSREYCQGNKDGIHYRVDGEGYNYVVDSLFYVKTKNGYEIHNYNDTLKTKDTFENVKWLSSTSARVSAGEQCGIVDRNCDLVIWGDYEDVSEPLDGKAFVKKNGRWKLIDITAKKNNHTSVKYSGSSYTLREETGFDASNIFEVLPSSFAFMSGAGSWSTYLSIQPDGSFSGNFHDSNMDGVQLCDFNGSLSPAKKTGKYTYKTSIVSLHSKHYYQPAEEEKEELYNRENEYPYGLDDAKDLIIYCPGMPVSDLSEDCLGWCHTLRSGKYDRIPKGMFVIYNPNGKQAFESTTY